MKCSSDSAGSATQGQHRVLDEKRGRPLAAGDPALGDGLARIGHVDAQARDHVRRDHRMLVGVAERRVHRDRDRAVAWLGEAEAEAHRRRQHVRRRRRKIGGQRLEQPRELGQLAVAQRLRQEQRQARRRQVVEQLGHLHVGGGAARRTELAVERAVAQPLDGCGRGGVDGVRRPRRRSARRRDRRRLPIPCECGRSLQHRHRALEQNSQNGRLAPCPLRKMSRPSCRRPGAT